MTNLSNITNMRIGVLVSEAKVHEHELQYNNYVNQVVHDTKTIVVWQLKYLNYICAKLKGGHYY